uniref:Collectin-12 n=1 Tax=Periophthalmus magnuspinnatus TaxID=409849 RepID=A0A3B4A111_9GOBI
GQRRYNDENDRSDMTEGIQEGTECTKCKNDWALRAAIALLYVLCALLTIAVAVLGFKVVQRMDNVTEGMQNYGGKISDVETDLKKFGNQAGQKSINATSEIRTFKSDLETLRRQLDEIALRATKNRDVLEELRLTGGDMQTTHTSLQGVLDSNSASLRSVNQTLTSYSAMLDNLQTNTAYLQSEIQTQVKVQGESQVTISALNISQTQQRNLLSSLQKTVEDAGQAVQRLKNDYQGLQQSARQARSDTEWLKEKVQNLQVLAANNSALTRSNGEALEDLGVQLSTLASQIQNASTLTEIHDQSLRELMDHQRDHDNSTSARFDEVEARLDRHESDMDRVTGNVSFSSQLLGAISSDLNGMRACAETVMKHTDLIVALNSSVTEARADSRDLKAQQDDLVSRLDKEVTSLSTVMEEMKLVDSKHSQLITNFTILQGPPGPRGPKGDRGAQGPVGQSGPKGDKGDKGAAGVVGPKGERGAPGPTGAIGPKGAAGVRGLPGAKGSRGAGGRPGIPGEKGDPGSQGQPGRDGMVCGVLWAPSAPLGLQVYQGSQLRLLGSNPLPPLLLFPVSDICTIFIILRCPLNFKKWRGSCYYFSSVAQRLNFDEANKFCANISTQLLIISDNDEQQYIQNSIAGKTYFWLGLTDREKENEWKWVDGTLPQNWKPGQPDNWTHGHEDGEDCAGLIHQAKWNDFYCTDRIGFICERPADGLHSLYTV